MDLEEGIGKGDKNMMVNAKAKQMVGAMYQNMSVVHSVQHYHVDYHHPCTLLSFPTWYTPFPTLSFWHSSICTLSQAGRLSGLFETFRQHFTGFSHCYCVRADSQSSPVWTFGITGKTATFLSTRCGLLAL